jgi:hypothetical protein
MGVSRAKQPHRDLYAAIGRVAASSAILEDTLRSILKDLSDTEYSDEAWILFEGQSMDWLINGCFLILKHSGPSHRWYNYGHELIKLLGECKEKLQKDRNVVIHGIWKDYCEWSNEEEEHRNCTLRPSDSQDDHRIYYFMRSNQRRVFHCVHLAVSDLQELANRIQRVNSELWQLKKEVDEAERRRWKERKYGESAGV